MRRPVSCAATAALLVLAAACGGGGDGGEADASSAAPGEAALTAEQLEKGIGPVASVSLGELDPELAARGEEQFRMKCSACHKFGERYVGPDLADVLDRRTPEYVMNMIINPAEMLEKHPEARAMLAQFLTPMPEQNIDRDTARSLLEYLRQMQQTASAQ